ncbi:MAG: cytochrome C, partial [Planctomycetota bacterium]
MRLAYTGGIILGVFTVCGSADDAWETIRVHDQFHAEGASAGDLNGDDNLDVVAGPLCFLGPDFKKSIAIAEPKTFPIAGYSDQFFSHVLDANGDGASDVLVIGFPGQAARMYINPGHDSLNAAKKVADWTMHNVADIVDNESPRIVDLIPGGLPEIVCGRGGQYGYYQAGDDATSPWQWTAISRPGTCGGRFAHGLGVGDVNGDGRPDVLDRSEWWEHPAESSSDSLWKQHRWADAPIGGGGAQMHTYDFDGDGDI